MLKVDITVGGVVYRYTPYKGCGMQREKRRASAFMYLFLRGCCCCCRNEKGEGFSVYSCQGTVCSGPGAAALNVHYSMRTRMQTRTLANGCDLPFDPVEKLLPPFYFFPTRQNIGRRSKASEGLFGDTNLLYVMRAVCFLARVPAAPVFLLFYSMHKQQPGLRAGTAGKLTLASGCAVGVDLFEKL